MSKSRSPGRRLRLESLEERRMLAVFTVDDSFASNDAAAHQFTTIQAAVDAASAGDKIKVKAGTYAENVIINKQLTLEGANASLKNDLNSAKASIVDPVNNGTASSAAIGFDLQTDGIVIKGFTIGEFDSNTDPDGTIGIRTSAAHADYKIEENVIEANTIGIYLNSETSTTTTPSLTKVEDNVIRNNNRAGTNTGNGIFSNLGLQNAEIEDNSFTGTNSVTSIRIVGTAGDSESETSDTLQSAITIHDNKFKGTTGGGIYFENVVDSIIDDNDLKNIALTGIQLNGGNERVTVEDNDLDAAGTQNLFGIILSDELEISSNQNNTIKDNEISDAGLTGLVIRDSSSNTIQDNEVEGSKGGSLTNQTDGNGISLESADNNTLTHNKTKDNARHGIFVDASSTGNTLTKNKSKDNNTSDVSAFDYNDLSTGTGTANTGNTYQKNKGRTQNVTGLIAKFI